MAWLKNKLTVCIEWIKSKLQSIRLWTCVTIGCTKWNNSSECIDKVVEKTKLKLRKKVNKRKK